MPGTSKISDYVGIRIPKPVVADMKRLADERNVSLSKWMIEVLSQAVKGDNTKNGDNTITLPVDLLAKIQTIKDVKSGKKTVAEWAISKVRFHAFGSH